MLRNQATALRRSEFSVILARRWNILCFSTALMPVLLLAKVSKGVDSYAFWGSYVN